MNILVTGAAGFIGSHTAERLCDAGYHVIGVDNYNDYYNLELKELNSRTLANKGITMINKDLRDDDLSSVLPSNVSYIFHFAAQPGISSTSSFEDYFTNNVIGTKIFVIQFPDMTYKKILIEAMKTNGDFEFKIADENLIVLDNPEFANFIYAWKP